MSGTRRSARTRAATSTINVKLNEQNEIEYFKVENDMEEDDDDIIDDPDHVEHENDAIGHDAEDDEDVDRDDDEVDGDEDEEEEELIVNADGTMSIKIPEKKPKKKKVPVHHICAKCSKVLSSGAVSWPMFGRDTAIMMRSEMIDINCQYFCFVGIETTFELV